MPQTTQIIVTTTGANVVRVQPQPREIVLAGSRGPQGLATGVFQTVHTFAIGGFVAIPVGQVDYIPPFFFCKRSNQASQLVAVRAVISTGTSVTAKLQKNGTDITGFTGMSITPTAASITPTAVNLANNDMIQLIVTGISGAPQNLTVTLVIEHTVS